MRRAPTGPSLAVLALALASTSLPGAALAASPAEIDRLYQALDMPQVIQLMSDEGRNYAETLREDLFPSRDPAAWEDVVSAVYAPDRMEEVMRAAFAEEMESVAAPELLEFYESEFGGRVVGLELDARRAMLDDDVEAAAEEAARDLRDQTAPRVEQLDRFIEANDLIELNVVGALNSNYAFYDGLAQGQALPGEMTEDDMLRDVWTQEPEIRAETIEWLYAYLGLAYEPLSDEELERYTELSQTDPGTALNHALFAAFDVMYADISRNLGQSAAEFMAGQDI
ncbi:DUF2059 domain-containing protein [Mesobaculum littorinae]|uniref:DUF2059 domain-containing protein n=1 Tax=Mesobaculum littorinae TaxID=2486419 RepID=A0A438AM62_9RHOB|nr:DUF2059 domain-containing protein [Mesobaculum littorinae]RVV99749.1 DUF2059 domain-containing protein [Mesobaculum littorinae]